MMRSRLKKKTTIKKVCQVAKLSEPCSITKEEVFSFLKRAALSYDREPQEGIHGDRLEALANELLQKLNY
jgi:hypothetical protein